MRLPRPYVLPVQSLFHFMWRAINGEFFLSSDEVKRAFLDSLFRFLGRSGGEVLVYAFVVMSNHFHGAGELLGDSRPFSCWMRSANSSFAQWLNRKLNRRGPVAQDRPKTVVAEDQQQLKRLMFYIDWNPVRAGMCDHPSEYPFSSYRFYAYGEVNAWTQHLTQPPWYRELGDDDHTRQRRYREECDRYHDGGLIPSEREADTTFLIGEPGSASRRHSLMRAIVRVLNSGAMGRAELDPIVAEALAPAGSESTVFKIAGTGPPREPSPSHPNVRVSGAPELGFSRGVPFRVASTREEC